MSTDIALSNSMMENSAQGVIVRLRSAKVFYFLAAVPLFVCLAFPSARARNFDEDELDVVNQKNCRLVLTAADKAAVAAFSALGIEHSVVSRRADAARAELINASKTIQSREYEQESLSELNEKLSTIEQLDSDLGRPIWSARRRNAMRIILALQPVIDNGRLPELLADSLYYECGNSGQSDSIYFSLIGFRSAAVTCAASVLSELKSKGPEAYSNAHVVEKLSYFLVWITGGLHETFVVDSKHINRVSKGLRLSVDDTQKGLVPEIVRVRSDCA
jgi:hypothetical protein